MANFIQRTVLVDSQRHFVLHFWFQSDGSGDLVNEVVIDPVVDFQNSTFQPMAVSLGIDELWWDSASIFGASFSGTLSFEAPTQQFIWSLGANPGDTHLCFETFGGIKDKTGIDGTGKILINTKGLVDLSAQGSLILSVKKYSRPVSQYPMGAIGGPVSESNLNLEVPNLASGLFSGGNG
jgi:hypothetical protein